MAIRSRGTNNSRVGYSEESLAALERGKYDQLTSRDPKYSTSQDQLRQVKELPTLKPSATVKAEKSISSKPKAQDNYVVHRDKYDELMQDSGLANDIMKLATINYSNANQDATVSQEWADTFGAKAITGGLTKTDYIESLKKKYGLSSRELNDMALTFHSDANKKEVEDYARDLENIGKNHAVLGSLGSFVGTLGSGVEGLYNTVVGGITGDDRYLSNMFSTTKNSPRQGVKENIKSDLGKGVYDVGMGIGDMAVGTAAGSAPAILAGNTANEAQASARERGSSVRRASAYAAGAGALDYITNTIGLDKAKKKAISSIKGAGLKKFIGQNFMAGLGEAGENVIQDIGQSFLDAIINGENAELNQSFQNKVASGMSEDEAFSETAKEYASQLAMSGGLGFGMGSAMQAGASALPALRGMNRSKSDVPNIDPEIQNAIETSEAAQAEIQNLQNQLPKVEAQSAPKITLTPEESARLQQSKPAETTTQISPEELAELNKEFGNIWADEPKAEATPTKPVENKIVNESAPRNPRIVAPLEGAELEQANARRGELKSEIERKKIEVETNKRKWETIPDKQNRKKAAAEKVVKASERELKALQDEDAQIKKNMKGYTMSSKEYIKQVDNDLYKQIYSRNEGLMDNLNYAAKFAGDSPEAKQLAKEIKDIVSQYIETGDAFNTILSPQAVEKIAQLDDLAKSVDKEYLGYHFNDIFGPRYIEQTDSYDTKKPSIWNKITENDRLEKINQYYQSNFGQADTNAPKMDESTTGQDRVLTPEETKVLQDVVDGKYDIPETGNEVPNVKPTEPQAPTEAPKVPEVTNVPPQTPPTDIGTTPANGEEKIRSFSERGSKDKSLPDEVRKELKEDTYSVVRNADVEARTDELFDGNDLIQTRSNLEQAIKNHDPVAAPLSYKLAKAYIDAGEYDAATDVIESVSAELTRGGQFTQAAKLAMMQNDPMAAMRAYKKDLQNVNQWGKEKYGKKWNKLELSQEDMDLFNSVSKGDKEALNNVVSQLNTKFGRQVPATLWDKLVAASKTSMLLNLRTQGRNIISNAAMLPVRSLSDRVSAVGQNIAHLINPNVKVTQSVTGGTSEQKDIAKQVFENLRESILGENKMKDSTKSDILSNRQIFNDDFIGRFIDKQTNGGLQRLNEKLGGNANKSTMETLSNFTYWLMGDFGDTPFVRKNFVNRLASYMKAQGINNIDDIPDDAIAIATEEALKATFKDDNAFSNALAGIKKKSGKFGEIALPFVKTPANLAMRGIDYSPAGLINTFRKIRSGADANKVIDELAKNLTGTAMIFLGYKLREKGILSGNYSDDKDEKAWQKQQGMLENAVHVGDNYYTFDWAQPTSTPLIIGSVLFDATNNSDEENNGLLKAINSGKDAAVAVGNSWISTSPLQSLSDIMGGGEYNNDGGVAGNVLNEVIEFPQRFIPAQLGAATRTIDPVIRDTYSNDSTLTGTLGNQARALQSRIPQLSKRLPASYDTWGNERTRSDTKGEAFFAQNINPGQLGNKNETPLDAEITRIYNATGNKDVFPLSAARSLNLGNDGNIKLTNKQHSDYQKMLGQQSYKFANAIMNNDDYKSLSDDEKTKALKKAYDFSNALAKEKLFNHATDDGLKKIKEAFEKDGEKGVANFLMEKAKADKLGLDIDTYQKNQAEYTGGAEQYAKDNSTVKAINEKYGTNYNIESYNKYGSGLEQRAQDAQNAKQYGFVDKDGNANTDSYEKAVEIVGTDPQALSSYKEYKSHDYTKMRQKVPALIDNNAFTAEQKGMLVTGKTDPSKIDGKIATGAYEKGGWEGVWYYYMLKDYADANENGRLDKKEKASLRSFMESDSPYVTQIPDDVYYYLGNSIKDW